jgi:hypothetical protein
MNLISKIKSLDFPLGHYIVYGSAVMEINGIRESKDIDILIDEYLYKELRKRGWKRKWDSKRVFICKMLRKDDVECYTNLHWKDYMYSTQYLIDRAEVIEGIPFMYVRDYLEYKKHLPREKDKQDVILMEDYLKKNN